MKFFKVKVEYRKMAPKIKILKLDASKADYSAAVARLYKFENWLAEGDDISKINLALSRSFCAFGAFDESGKMVGFFRALSDGVSDAYLLDLIVDPGYRGMGVARALASAVLEDLKKCSLSWITCISAPEAVKVYAPLGEKMEGFVPFRLGAGRGAEK